MADIPSEVFLFVGNWRAVNVSYPNYADGSPVLFYFLWGNGSAKDFQLARSYLLSLCNVEVGERPISNPDVYLGRRVQLGASTSPELRVGPHHYHVVECGDKLKLSDDARRPHGSADEWELGQCSVVSLSSGISRICQP